MQPDLEIVSGPPPIGNSSTVRVAFEASVPDAVFECALRGRHAEPCSSPWTASGLADGAHQIYVRVAGDPYNGVTAWKSRDFAVDTIPPETAVSVSSTGSPYPAHAIRIHPTANETVTFECALDGAGFGPCPPNNVYARLPDGAHPRSGPGDRRRGQQ